MPAHLKLRVCLQRNDHRFPIRNRTGLQQQHFLFVVDEHLHLSRLFQNIQYRFAHEDTVLFKAERQRERFARSFIKSHHIFSTSPVA